MGLEYGSQEECSGFAGDFVVEGRRDGDAF
jgi:hypothetical protein